MMIVVLALALVLCAGAAWAVPSYGVIPATGGYTGTITDYQTNWWDVSGSSSWHGWWDVSGWVPAGGVGGDDGLTVTAYVELYASTSQQTNAVFHWGQPPFSPMATVLAGSVVENHPCWVGIRKANWVEADQAKASHLSFASTFSNWNPSGLVTTPVFPGTVTGDTVADIPLTFEMNVDGGAYAAMQWTGGVGSANWGWYSIGRVPVGSHNYSFKITALPNAYQGDGKYVLDPQVIVAPDL